MSRPIRLASCAGNIKLDKPIHLCRCCRCTEGHPCHRKLRPTRCYPVWTVRTGSCHPLLSLPRPQPKQAHSHPPQPTQPTQPTLSSRSFHAFPPSAARTQSVAATAEAGSIARAAGRRQATQPSGTRAICEPPPPLPVPPSPSPSPPPHPLPPPHTHPLVSLARPLGAIAPTARRRPGGGGQARPLEP